MKVSQNDREGALTYSQVVTCNMIDIYKCASFFFFFFNVNNLCTGGKLTNTPSSNRLVPSYSLKCGVAENFRRLAHVAGIPQTRMH